METIIQTPYSQIKAVKGAKPGFDNCVRTYRCSPEAVHLQIRALRGKTTSFAGVNLSFEDARKLANAILAAVQET